MSDLVPLESARFSMRIGQEVGDDDLLDLLETATQLVETRFLGYPIAEVWPDAESVPLPVLQAIKVAALDLYENPAAPLQNPDAIMNLVLFYRRLSFA